MWWTEYETTTHRFHHNVIKVWSFVTWQFDFLHFSCLTVSSSYTLSWFKKKKKKFILCISFKWKLLAFRVHWCVNDLIEVFSFSMFFASLVFRLNILSFNLDKQLRYNIIYMFLWKSLSSVNYIFWTEYKGNMFRINISQRVKMCSAL